MLFEKNNQLLERFNYDICDVLKNHLQAIESKYKIKINFYDVAGMRAINNKLEKIFTPYTSHANSFCSFIKESTDIIPCINTRMRVCQKCRDKMSPFYGRCFFGIEEFVFPIIAKNKLLGMFCIGMFFSDLNKSLEKLKRMAQKYELDYEKCKARFLGVTKEIDFDIQAMMADVSILCQLATFACFNENTITLMPEKRQILNKCKESSIVDNTISYIQENIGRPLSLKMLAANSYCNPNYLSNVFIKKTNQSIVDYINETRISVAKKYINYTDNSIAYISEMVGYNSAAYFSYIFKKATGVTPKEYRSINKGAANR